MKPWHLVLVAVLIVGTVLGVGYYLDHRWGLTTQELKAGMAALDKGLAANSAEIKVLAADELAAKQEARASAEALAAKIAAIHIEIPQQAQTMPMTQAVSETRRIIGDTGVDQVETGVMFTPPAFRFNLAKLMEGEQFSLALKDSMDQAVGLGKALAAADATIVVQKDSLFKKDEQIGNLNAQLSVNKKADTMKVVKGAGVGTLLGIILTLLLHK